MAFRTIFFLMDSTSEFDTPPLRWLQQTFLNFVPLPLDVPLAFFFLNDPAPTELYPLPPPDALPLPQRAGPSGPMTDDDCTDTVRWSSTVWPPRITTRPSISMAGNKFLMR